MMIDMARVADRFTTIRVIEYAPAYREGTLQVAREIHARSMHANLPLDEVKVIQQLALSGEKVPDRFFRIAVRRDTDEVVGGFYGIAHRTFFCNESVAKDIGWWVKEDARGSAAAILLLLSFEKWAKARGARKVMLGQTGVENIESTRKLFEHCGYAVTGYNTVKDI